MNVLKRNIDILLVLLVGFALRFTISFTHSYSNDELSAINRLDFESIDQMIETGVKTGDMHPAGVQMFMKAWSHIGGVNELGMRFPFVLFGCFSVWITFLIGRTYVNRQAGLIAALFLALLYFPIMNSEFARPYSPGLMFSLIAAWYYLRILFKTDRSYKDALLMGLAMAAGMYTHYFAFMFIGWMGVSGLVFVKRTSFKYVLIAGAFACLLFVPHISITQYHLSVGGLQWLAPPTADWLFQFLFHAFNESWLVVGVVTMLSVLTFIFSDRFVCVVPRVLWMSAIWFFGIFIVGYIYSITSTPILKFPVMLFALPFFLVLLGSMFSMFRYQAVLTSVLMVVIGYSTIQEKDLYGHMHYELFEEVAEDILSWQETYGEENTYVVYNLNNPNYMNFYANQWGREVKFDWDVLDYGDSERLREDLMHRTENYCIVGYSARHTLVQVFETCREFYPYILDYEKYNNSAVFLLSRWAPENVNQETEILDIFNPMDPPINSPWTYDYNLIEYWEQDSTNHFGASYVLDGEHPYGPEFRIRAGDIENRDEKYIYVKVRAQEHYDLQLTASVSAERDGVPVENQGQVWWYGRDLERMINTKREGYLSFAIPAFLQDDDIIKISLWSRNAMVPSKIGGVTIYLKDNLWN